MNNLDRVSCFFLMVGMVLLSTTVLFLLLKRGSQAGIIAEISLYTFLIGVLTSIFSGFRDVRVSRREGNDSQL